MVDKALVDKAVEKLVAAKRYSPRSDIESIAEFLSERPPFDDLDHGMVDDIAAAARKLLPAPAAPAAPAAGNRPGAFRHNGDAGGRAAPRRTFEAAPTPSAPFRFVTLPDKVAPGEKRPLNDPSKGDLCATIKVTWVAESPLLISEENEGNKTVEPMRLGKNGPFVIPGASLKGMIRAATEIVALGKLGFANLHHRYGLRDFEHPYYSEEATVSKVGLVRAGWLTSRQEDGKEVWELTPLGDNWAHIEISQMGFARSGNWKGTELLAKYRAIRATIESSGGGRDPVLFDFQKTDQFSPLVRDSTGRRIVHPEKDGQKGVYVFSGKVPGTNSNKRFEYVFFDQPSGTPIRIKPEVRQLFERLYSKPSKNKPEPDGNWKVLKPTLAAGRRIPVFYVGDPEGQGADFFFGLTRLFKIPHKRSVGDVLARSHAAHAVRPDWSGVADYHPDFVENLFGYVVERDDVGLDEEERMSVGARKGRVAFGFAFLEPGQPPPRLSAQPIETIMMAPRASYAPFYLRGKESKDYSAAEPPKLAGRKRYLPRSEVPNFDASLQMIRKMGDVQITAASRNGSVSNDVKSRLTFLLPGQGAKEIRFTSEIRLHNVTKAELGAVLFALTHGGNASGKARHMLGRARPFGAGQIRVDKAALTVIPNDDGDNQANAAHSPYLEAFIAEMRKVAPAYPNVDTVTEFVGLSQPNKSLALDYMPLNAFNEIRKEVKPLKTRVSREGRVIGPAAKPALAEHEKAGPEDRLLPVPKGKV